MNQLNLIEATLLSYDEGAKDNRDIYSKTASSLNVDESSFIKNVGKDEVPRNTFHRKVRWAQQSLKQAGLIEKVGRGQWSLTKDGKQTLTRINVDKYMIAASTELGAVIWGNSVNVFDRAITEDVHLCVTSPPYLGIVRSYGNHDSANEYIDFLLSVLTPIRKRMLPGANLALNLTNDSVLKKAFGARSNYLEKLIIKLGDELDLTLMDRLVWHAPDKAPKSYQVTKARTHLTSKYEPVLWFCTEPSKTFADNRRVLTPYKDQMKKIIAQGGEKRAHFDKDYTPNSRNGGFSTDNGGSIPGNILTFPTRCNENRKVQAYARELQLPVHGALYPEALASFLIKWLSPEGGMVIDPFGGYLSTASAAEKANRHWLTSELHWEYIKPALLRFKSCLNFYVNPLFEMLSENKIRCSLSLD